MVATSVGTRRIPAWSRWWRDGNTVGKEVRLNEKNRHGLPPGMTGWTRQSDWIALQKTNGLSWELAINDNEQESSPVTDWWNKRRNKGNSPATDRWTNGEQLTRSKMARWVCPGQSEMKKGPCECTGQSKERLVECVPSSNQPTEREGVGPLEEKECRDCGRCFHGGARNRRSALESACGSPFVWRTQMWNGDLSRPKPKQ